MRRVLARLGLAVLATSAIAAPASGGLVPEDALITVTPETIATTDPVTIVVSSEACVDGMGLVRTITVTVTDPDGMVAFTNTYPGAPSVTVPFDDTLTPGVYTVAAVCEHEEAAMSAEAAPAATSFIYPSTTFTAVEPRLGDVAGVDEAVIAATPTFTG